MTVALSITAGATACAVPLSDTLRVPSSPAPSARHTPEVSLHSLYEGVKSRFQFSSGKKCDKVSGECRIAIVYKVKNMLLLIGCLTIYFATARNSSGVHTWISEKVKSFLLRVRIQSAPAC